MEIQDLAKGLADIATRVPEGDSVLLAQAVIELRRWERVLLSTQGKRAERRAVSDQPKPDKLVIVNAVAEAFSLHPDRFFWRDRQQHLSEARAVAMYLLYELSGEGWSDLGRYLHKDHSSIWAGYRKVSARMARDRAYAGLVHGIGRAIRNEGAV